MRPLLNAALIATCSLLAGCPDSHAESGAVTEAEMDGDARAIQEAAEAAAGEITEENADDELEKLEAEMNAEEGDED